MSQKMYFCFNEFNENIDYDDCQSTITTGFTLPFKLLISTQQNFVTFHIIIMLHTWMHLIFKIFRNKKKLYITFNKPPP